MRFSLFYEHQHPRPWSEGSEHRLMKDALDQIELADRVGFNTIWEVEHHFMEEYSHSSAPEVFLAAVSQRTKNIHLGHGIIHLPHEVNHPARTAERVATLDLISDGRVEFGTGESSSAAEIGGFGIDREVKREQWVDAIDSITRMFVEEPFAGWDSDFLSMPVRNVVPKPMQKPHPPLWVACSRRETLHFAARNGIGALSFSFVEPEDAGKWVKEYYDLIESDECMPAGFAVNPNVVVVLPMMCHKDEAEAIERGIDGAHFFGYSLAHYYGITPHHPANTDVHEEFLERREQTGFARAAITPGKEPLGVKILQHGLGSLRGAIGTPDQIRDLIRRYEAVGVDEIGFVLQAGHNTHEHICESLELFGKEIIPEFADERPAREAAKAERLAPAIERALARREPARTAVPGYKIDELSEVEHAYRAGGKHRAKRRKTRASATGVKAAARKRGEAVLSKTVAGRSDRQLQRLFGSSAAQRVIFTAMARQFNPEMAFGFKGDIVYELTDHSDNGGTPDASRWRLKIDERKASASRANGRAADPAVTVKIAVPDFARVIAGEVDPLAMMLEDRMEVAGDLTVASRMIEMFGGPSPY